MKKIVVLPHGWVFVGDYEEVGGKVVLTNAFDVRRYFTGSGLGPLAAGGPNTDGCILDDAKGTVVAFASNVIATIDCDAEAWA